MTGYEHNNLRNEGSINDEARERRHENIYDLESGTYLILFYIEMYAFYLFPNYVNFVPTIKEKKWNKY